MANAAVQLSAMGRRFRELGSEGKGIQKELMAGLQRGARPAIGAIRWEALLTLPSSGGDAVRAMRITERVTIDGKEFKRRARVGSLKPNQPLAQRVAAASYTARIVKGHNRLQVLIRGRAKSGQVLDLRAIDEGLVRHPVFGHKDRWVEQQVKPGFFTRACEANLKEVRQGVQQALDAVCAKLKQPL